MAEPKESQEQDLRNWMQSILGKSTSLKQGEDSMDFKDPMDDVFKMQSIVDKHRNKKKK